MIMEVYSAYCECCGLREECTQEYISQVKANFEGKWLCGLCSKVVGEGKEINGKIEDALKAHMLFCNKFRANPAVLVADGMRQMLRKRSGDHSTSKKTLSSSSLKMKQSQERSETLFQS